jgi:hypothetical protein
VSEKSWSTALAEVVLHGGSRSRLLLVFRYRAEFVACLLNDPPIQFRCQLSTFLGILVLSLLTPEPLTSIHTQRPTPPENNAAKQEPLICHSSAEQALAQLDSSVTIYYETACCKASAAFDVVLIPYILPSSSNSP